jgi:hypothetical protein
MLHACCLSRAPGSGFRAVCRPPLADGKHRCGDEGDEDTKAHQDISGASAHVRPYADETAMAWSRSESLAARCAPGNGPIRPVTHHRHNNLRKPTRTSAYPAAVSQPHSPALAPAVSHSHSHSRSPSLGLSLARRSSSLAGMHVRRRQGFHRTTGCRSSRSAAEDDHAVPRRRRLATAHTQVFSRHVWRATRAAQAQVPAVATLTQPAVLVNFRAADRHTELSIPGLRRGTGLIVSLRRTGPGLIPS